MAAIVKFHKDGDNMAVSTDAQSEEEFLMAAIPALARQLGGFVNVLSADGSLMSDETGHIITETTGVMTITNDFEFQLDRWIPQIIDIACKLRGYKSAVHEHRVLVAGHWLPDELVSAFSPLRFEKATVNA